MKFAIQKGSFQDSPTGSAMVIWLPGCHLKCKYCFNFDLASKAKLQVADVSQEIRSLRSTNANTGESFHTYDWVVLSGGEPLLNADTCEQFLSEVRRISNGDDSPIKTGVFTSGTKYDELKDLVSKGLLDYVHVDYKLKPEDLEKYGFDDKDRAAFEKTVKYVTKQYVEKRIEYLKFGTVLTKQDATPDYVVDMIREASRTFPVQPTYLLKEEQTRDKFVWEFVDFFQGSGDAKVLDPEYTRETSQWDAAQKQELCRYLKIVNTFKSVAVERPKRELVLHPSHYNRGKFEVIDVIQDQFSNEEFKGFLRGNAMKYVMRAPFKDEESLDYKKAIFYLERLVKLSKED